MESDYLFSNKLNTELLKKLRIYFLTEEDLNKD